MNLRRIKHTLLRMSPEEKVIGLGALVILFGTFMPWHGIVMSFDKKTITETGFSGDLGVIGFVIFIMSLFTLITLVAENMRLPLPQFGYKKEQILFFFLGQSFFLTLLTMAIYTKRSLEFTDAGLRFGIFIVLLGAFFGALSAFALIQKTKKKEVQEFFQHEAEEEALTEELPAETTEPEVEEVVMPEPEPEPEPEPMFFEEDAEAMPEEVPETPEPEAFSDYVPEDDMIEDIEETPQAEVEVENQEEDDTKEDKSKGGLSMNFYDDK